MRRGELLNMQWQHINWINKTLLIPVTKTDQPRTVPLTVEAIAHLRQLSIQDLGPVFRVKADSVSQAFKRSCAKAKIDDMLYFKRQTII